MAGKSHVKRILFLIGEREFVSVQERLLHIPSRLAKSGFSVDVVTYKEELHEKAESFYKNTSNVKTIFLKSKPLIWSPQQRDDFVKIFIKHTFDFFIPDTDLKYWKTSAFDDFRGHIASYAFSGLESDYDLLIMPLPSSDEPPTTECDVFYSTLVFYAKEKGIPIVGLQIYPAIHTPPLFLRILDYFVVKEESELQYYQQYDISPERIFVLDDQLENYCITTVEDVYKNLMFDEQIAIGKDELGILIVNHSKYRPQIIEALQALSRLNIKKSTFFYKRGYYVRELSEDQIVDEILKPYIEKTGGNYYIVQEGSLVKLIMMCDIVVSATYIIPLGFAVKHFKDAVVYNPLVKTLDIHDNVSFVNNKDALAGVIMESYSKKQSRMSMTDIMKRILS
ncbi:hypothetical protein [Dissulfurispira sp.]|uniref:hypothetical protein n=1 Tax=Dissulfurispira sp. TaxID=2817609 RepID=UPI002FD8AAD1